MSRITTHVLDGVLGRPVIGISIRLEAARGDAWTLVRNGTTDEDGRCRDLASNAERGRYRLVFVTGSYMQQKGRATIYPEVAVVFECDGAGHYHLPLLLSDNSYTTYRGC
jgi:5-hydroxyisourate hydrolase